MSSQRDQLAGPDGFGPPDNYLTPPERWTSPFPAHRVFGNLYSVGTRDLGVFLLVTDTGHILINSGLAGSEMMIRENIESLGFHLEDVRILLTMQAHWDHTASLAEIKRLTGARLWATEKDSRMLEDGGWSDPHFGGSEMFEPVEVDEMISEGDVVVLGDTELTVHLHPGHTEGSSSYTTRIREGDRDRDVAIVNMGTVNAGKRLFNDPTYPGVADDFAETFSKQAAMSPDVWVAAHASHYGLHSKYKPGQEYRVETFEDPAGYAAAVEGWRLKYEDLLAAERRAAGS